VDETRLHTFLFADLAGFTALTEAHGDERAADLVSDFCSRVRALLPEHGAEEVKAIGDALMLRTGDATSAVQLARRLVDEVGGRHGFPAVRVGVHTGPAVERERDWFGATVNVASRVADLADADEVLITRATFEAVGDPAPELRLTPRGSHRLRNLREPIEVFAAASASTTAAVERAIDPVCRMAVDTGASHPSHHFGRQTYWFCSDACGEAFRTDPGQYVGRHSRSSDVRTSDASRERAIRLLRSAHTEGRISVEELEERVAHASAARTRGELAALMRDLPDYRRTRRRGRWRRSVRAAFRGRR
jgi:class 3 adenylate cyclase